MTEQQNRTEQYHLLLTTPGEDSPLILSLQPFSDFPIPKDIHLITLPVLCNVYGKKYPDASAQMIYQLLQCGKFVSFSASTIFTQIKNNNFQVSEEFMQPFLICNSDYDMQSFSRAYLGAIYRVKEEHEAAAEALSEVILQNSRKIWQRGTYYRENFYRYPDDKDSSLRAASIFKYVSTIVVGIEQIWTSMPEKLGALRDELKNFLMDELQ